MLIKKQFRITPWREMLADPWYCSDLGERFVRFDVQFIWETEGIPFLEPCITSFHITESKSSYSKLTKFLLLRIIAHPVKDSR